MKNPAAEQRGSSVEKKKSCGLFSFCTGLPRHPWRRNSTPRGGVFDPPSNKTICGNLFEIMDLLPSEFVDLLIIDPPYNLDKNFHRFKFSKTNDDAYLEYLESWFPKIMGTLKPADSVYICGDWKINRIKHGCCT
ncbi:MAG: hypothetical protein LBO76_07400 [Treponema sp.]|jgi:DNA modification methylase|nr:hypothetical protein [Treponema sp.]